VAPDLNFLIEENKMKKIAIFLIALIFISSFLVGCTKVPKAPEFDTARLIEEMEMIKSADRMTEEIDAADKMIEDFWSIREQ